MQPRPRICLREEASSGALPNLSALSLRASTSPRTQTNVGVIFDVNDFLTSSSSKGESEVAVKEHFLQSVRKQNDEVIAKIKSAFPSAGSLETPPEAVYKFRLHAMKGLKTLAFMRIEKYIDFATDAAVELLTMQAVHKGRPPAANIRATAESYARARTRLTTGALEGTEDAGTAPSGPTSRRGVNPPRPSQGDDARRDGRPAERPAESDGAPGTRTRGSRTRAGPAGSAGSAATTADRSRSPRHVDDTLRGGGAPQDTPANDGTQSDNDTNAGRVTRPFDRFKPANTPFEERFNEVLARYARFRILYLSTQRWIDSRFTSEDTANGETGRALDTLFRDTFEALTELSNRPGLERLVGLCCDIILQVVGLGASDQRGGALVQDPLNVAIVGDAGVGKTDASALFARVLLSFGVLTGGSFEKTSGDSFVAAYEGQTKTLARNRLEQSLERVLIIDEAYTLAPTSKEGGFARESLDQFVQWLSTYASLHCVVFLGYKQQIDELIQLNQGLKRRIRQPLVELRHYTANEMLTIFDARVIIAKVPATTPAARLFFLRYVYLVYQLNFANLGEVFAQHADSVRVFVSMLRDKVFQRSVLRDEKIDAITPELMLETAIDHAATIEKTSGSALEAMTTRNEKAPLHTAFYNAYNAASSLAKGEVPMVDFPHNIPRANTRKEFGYDTGRSGYDAAELAVRQTMPSPSESESDPMQTT